MADSNNIDKKSRGASLLLHQEELLAEKVKQYPCLFDKSKKAYKERDVVKNAWEAVASSLEFVENGE